MNSYTLGNKIRQFRKSRKMSQFQLETEIGASPGTISRIENGVVNPNKETLYKIIDALKLSIKESSDLFDITPLFPTEEEIESALDEVSDVMNSDKVAYLLDDYGVVRAVSNGLLKLFGVSKEWANLVVGENLLTILFQPQYGVRSLIDQEKIFENYALELARAKSELTEKYYGNYFQTLLESIKDTPDFDKIMDMVPLVSKDLLSLGSRVSYMNLNGTRIKVNHATEVLKNNPRFRIVEMFNAEEY